MATITETVKHHLGRLATAEQSSDELTAITDLSKYLSSVDCQILDQEKGSLLGTILIQPDGDTNNNGCYSTCSARLNGSTTNETSAPDSTDGGDVFSDSERTTHQSSSGLPRKPATLQQRRQLPRFASDFLELRFLAQGLDATGPFPHVPLTTAFPDAADLDAFVAYVLQRRYGWSEGESGCHDATHAFRAGRFRRLSGRRKSMRKICGASVPSDQPPSPRSAVDICAIGENRCEIDVGTRDERRPREKPGKEEAEIKPHLNELLDDLIKWIFSESMNNKFLDGILYALSQATHQAVVRKQTYYHFFEWTRTNCMNFEDGPSFDRILSIIVSGLTDIWSAIRSMSAAKLTVFVDRFSEDQLTSFFNCLVEVCKSPENGWQAKEGGILGIYTIMKKFGWSTEMDRIPKSPGSATASGDKQQRYTLKYGKLEFSGLPEFIRSQMHDTVFLLLRHEQLTIREHASRTFSVYLCRCEFSEALASLKEVVCELRKGLGLNLDTDKVDASQIKWMDAFSSEGFLSVCVSLIKHIPPKFFMANWTLYFSTFSLFLMHPASTVRQATSALFKFIVAKDTSRPEFVAMVLEGLSKEWAPSMELLLTLENPGPGNSRPESPSLENSCHASEAGSTAEDQNGPTVRKSNTANANVHDSNPPNSNIHESKVPNCDVPATRVNLVHSTVKGVRSSVNKLSIDTQPASDAWEWREGRLLAYELIFHFLIKNHWLYTFGIPLSATAPVVVNSTLPTSHMYPSKSMTETGMNHKKLSAKVEKTNSYAGESLRERSKQFKSDDSPMVTDAQMSASMSRRATMSQLRADLPITRPTKHHSYYESATPSNATRPRLASLHSKSVIVNLLNLENGQRTSDSDPSKMSNVLRRILYQCIESLADGRWELRRMALQVLPCVVEAIRWYNVRILESLWRTYLSEEFWENRNSSCNLMMYGACLSYIHSMTHGAKLKALQKDPPEHWRNVRRCIERTERLVSAVSNRLPMVLDVLKRAATGRTCSDKMATLGVTGLLLTATSYEQHRHETVIPAINAFYRHLMATCHPEDSFCTSYNDIVGNRSAAVIYIDGFLSCNPHRSENVSFVLSHLEKHILCETHSLLCDLAKQLCVTLTSALLPVMAFYLRITHEEHHVNKSFHDGLQAMLRKIETLELDPSDSRKWYESRTTVMQQLCLILVGKDSELHTIKQAMELASSIMITSTRSANHLTPVLAAVASLLPNVPEPREGRENTHYLPNRSNGSLAGLQFLDNNIQTRVGDSTAALQLLLDESDSEEDVSRDIDEAGEVHLPESMALSSGAHDGPSGGGGLPADHSGATGEDTDGESDWDSWSEDDESDDARISYLVGRVSESLITLANSGSAEIVCYSFSELQPQPRKLLISHLLACTTHIQSPELANALKRLLR